MLITPVIGCSAFQNSGEHNAGVAKNLLTSDYAVVELGNIWLFDEKNSTVGISYILRPGPDTEYGKYYDKSVAKRQISGLRVLTKRWLVWTELRVIYQRSITSVTLTRRKDRKTILSSQNKDKRGLESVP